MNNINELKQKNNPFNVKSKRENQTETSTTFQLEQKKKKKQRHQIDSPVVYTKSTVEQHLLLCSLPKAFAVLEKTSRKNVSQLETATKQNDTLSNVPCRIRYHPESGIVHHVRRFE
jgi:hypothetical protein